MATPHLQPVHTGFNPTRQDIQIVSRILTGLHLPRHTTPTGTPPPPDRLPTELALSILSHADYNPRITAARVEETDYHANSFLDPAVAALYLMTHDPLPRHFRRAREVTIQTRGVDQDWAAVGAQGPYDYRYTWCAVSILRPVEGVGVQPDGQPLGGRADVLHTFRSPEDAKEELEQLGWRMVGHEGGGCLANEIHPSAVTACAGLINYRVDWVAGEPTKNQNPGAVSAGEEFLSALMPGDKIALWARAEQGACALKVAEAAIEIVYEVKIGDAAAVHL